MILDADRVDEMSQSGRGQVLIPWPNRISNGSYEFGGRRHQLGLNEPEQSNTIHKLVRWSAYVMLTTRDVLPDVNRRAIAVEPMTCPPNAFATGEAIIELARGETFQGSWGIAATLPPVQSIDR